MATSVASPPSAGDTLNKAWKNDKSNFGLRMMQKMGWTEGKGLGKNEDGIAENVRVVKKSNNLGLGATRDSTGSAGWNSTAMNFNSVLEELAKAYGTAKSRASDPSKEGKKARTEKKKRKKDRVGNTADESEERWKKVVDVGDRSNERRDDKNDRGGANIGLASSTKAAFACPSRARRIKSKDVKSFSAADLRAILGQSAMPELPSNAMDETQRDMVRNGVEKKRQRKEEGTREAEKCKAEPQTSRTDQDIGTALPTKLPRLMDGDVSAVTIETTSNATEPRKKKKKKRKERGEAQVQDQVDEATVGTEKSVAIPGHMDEKVGDAREGAGCRERGREEKGAKGAKSKAAGRKRGPAKDVVEDRVRTKRSKRKGGE